MYIGSFSKLLLPSIRLSFMILPPPLLEAYRKKAAFYNQTASKAEQIALCQFIRDGHLTSQTRKLKRLYSQKLKTLQKDIKSVFGENCPLRTGAAGTSLALTLPFSGSSSELKEKAEQCGLALSFLKKKNRKQRLFFPAPPCRQKIFFLLLSFYILFAGINLFCCQSCTAAHCRCRLQCCCRPFFLLPQYKERLPP